MKFPEKDILELLEKIDVIDSSKVLKSKEAGEWLETDFFELSYRLKQVDYHKENILVMLKEESHVERLKSVLSDDDDISFSVSNIKWSDQVGFEFSAWLFSLRATLDVFASILIRFIDVNDKYHHERKTQHYSFNDIAEKKLYVAYYSGSTPLLKVIKRHWGEWMKNIVSYRNEMMHRRIIYLKERHDQIGYKTLDDIFNPMAKDTFVVKDIKLPVIIPKSARQKRQKITRMHLMSYPEYYENEGYAIITKESSVNIPLSNPSEGTYSYKKILTLAFR